MATKKDKNTINGKLIVYFVGPTSLRNLNDAFTFKKKSVKKDYNLYVCKYVCVRKKSNVL